jgi:hypothetical protein
MRTMQTSYAAGVLAPSLHARTDLAKWQIGLAEANNMLVHVHGGISNRPGTRYVGDALGQNRLIEFEYSADDTYALEFTDLKMRIIRDGSFVVYPATEEVAQALAPDGTDYFMLGSRFDTSATIHTETVLKYTGTGILNVDMIDTLGLAIGDDNKLKVITDNGSSSFTKTDTGLTLTVGQVHTIEVDISGKSVTVTLDSGTPFNVNIGTDTYYCDNASYESQLFALGTGSVNYALSCAEVRSYVYQESAVDVLSLTPHIDGYFVDSVAPSNLYNLGAGSNIDPVPVITVVQAHPQAGDIVEVTSPFAYADLKEVRYVQREDVMYLTHVDYVEQVLTRRDHHDWEFESATYTPSIEAPSGLSGSYDGTGSYDVEYQVAAISLSGEESIPSDLITVSADASNNWELGKRVLLSWSPAAGADLYVVYKNSRGYFGFIGSTTDTEFRDDNIAPDSADGPKTSRDPFDGERNRPGTVGIYQQRKVYGRTTDNPQTTWLTQSGTMDNLSVSRPLKDTDAITAQLDSNQVNHILHYVAMKDLITITNNGIWTLSSGANNDTLTPSTIRYDLQSADGGSYLRPIVSGNTILMVPSYRNGAKELFYQIQAGGFEGSDLHLLSNHLFDNDKIVDWAFQRDDSIVWCVMESGNLCTLTYLRSHDVVAWTTQDTQGTFESVTVVKNDSRDIPYFGTLRTINGTPTRFIEELCERLPGDVLEDSCFLDASISYDGAATDTFTGADHLAGETCKALADGNVIEDVVVDGTGGFTLPHEYSKVHLGLGYVADFETLDVDYQGQEGPGFGNLKNITEVTLAMEKTRGISVGPDDENLTEMKFRTDEDYDEHTRMFTGKKDITIEPMWDSNGRIHVRQPHPLPVTILSHIPEVHPGDE